MLLTPSCTFTAALDALNTDKETLLAVFEGPYSAPRGQRQSQARPSKKPKHTRGIVAPDGDVAAETVTKARCGMYSFTRKARKQSTETRSSRQRPSSPGQPWSPET